MIGYMYLFVFIFVQEKQAQIFGGKIDFHPGTLSAKAGSGLGLFSKFFVCVKLFSNFL